MNKRRWLLLLLSVAMVMTMLPAVGLAEGEEAGSEGLCSHHFLHTVDCGYVPVRAEVPCDMDCADLDGDGVIDHDKDCAYRPAMAGQPCAYHCEICASGKNAAQVQALIDALPGADSITWDNAEEVVAKLDEIDEAALSLTDDERDTLDFAKYNAAIAKLNELAGQTGAEQPVTLATTQYNISNGDVNITSPGDYSISGSGMNRTISIHTSGVVNLTFSNLNMTCGARSETKLVVNGGTVNIELDGTNIIQTGQDSQENPGVSAVYIASGAQLHFYDADNNGSITLHGSSNYYRGGTAVQGGNLYIHGGTVNLVGGNKIVNQYGKSFDGESLTISGGTVNCYAGTINSTAGGNVSVSNGLTVESGATWTIPTGSTIDIPAGATLTNNGTITNNGIIRNNGTLTNNGSVYVNGTVNGLGGDLYYPLTVTGGTADDNTSTYLDQLYGKAGGSIRLTATNVPVGQAVGIWKTSDSAVTVENNRFIMPAKALTVTAHYTNAPIYTVTIPATVELDSSVTVSASDVNVVSGSKLVIKLTDAQGFKLKTDEGAELGYDITKDNTALGAGDAILTVPGGTENASGSAELQFSAPTTAVRYSGKYKGTVTFTVAVQNGG